MGTRAPPRSREDPGGFLGNYNLARFPPSAVHPRLTTVFVERRHRGGTQATNLDARGRYIGEGLIPAWSTNRVRQSDPTGIRIRARPIARPRRSTAATVRTSWAN